MPFQLNVSKPGVDQGAIQLNMSKGDNFTILFAWESPDDLDGHAWMMFGPKLTKESGVYVLSTYNTKKWEPDRLLPVDKDGSFTLPCGALHHSGDSLTGVGKDIDELITVYGSRIPSGVTEMPLAITIHDRNKAFAQVQSASVRVLNANKEEVAHVELSNRFAQFTGVHIGTFKLRPNNHWEFQLIGDGYTGDFNTILAQF